MKVNVMTAYNHANYCGLTFQVTRGDNQQNDEHSPVNPSHKHARARFEVKQDSRTWPIHEESPSWKNISLMAVC